jgi:hypothetical protein
VRKTARHPAALTADAQSGAAGTASQAVLAVRQTSFVQLRPVRSGAGLGPVLRTRLRRRPCE